MANRYWRSAAEGNWSSATGWVANDAAYQLGVNDWVAKPTTGDNVYMGGTGATNSNCTVNEATSVIALYDGTGYTGAFAGSSAVNCSGSVTVGAGQTWTCTGALTLSGTGTITSNGNTLASPITINAPGNTINLEDDLNIGSNTFTLTAGTFDTSDGAAGVVSNDVTCGGFVSTSGSTRTLNFNASVINCLYFQNWTGGSTVNASSSTINVTATWVSSWQGGGKSYGDVNITINSSDLNLTYTDTFTNLSIIGPANNTTEITLSYNQTITGTLTITGNSAVNRLWVQSSTLGTARTITCNGTATLSNCDLQDITGSGVGWTAAGSYSGTSVGGGALSGCTMAEAAVFTTPATTTWTGAVDSDWNDAGNWSGAVPLVQDTAEFTGDLTGETVTMNMRLCSGIDSSGATGSPQIQWSQNTYNFGTQDFSGLVNSGSARSQYLYGRSAATLKGYASGDNHNYLIYAISNTYTLAGSFATTGNITLYNGTLSGSSYALTAAKILDSGTATRGYNLGSGTWTCTGTGTGASSPWYINSLTGLTLTPGTSTIKLTGNSTCEFSGKAGTYNNLEFEPTGASGVLTITDANTFNTIIADSTNGAQTIQFAANQTISGWESIGVTYAINVISSVAGTQRTITDTSGTMAIRLNGGYCSDMIFTGGAYWVLTNCDAWKSTHPTAPANAPTGCNYWNPGVR